MRVLYLFSGEQRKTSVATVLQSLAAGANVEVQVDEIDICRGAEHDMSNSENQARILQAVKQGILLTPPCSTWSRVRGANTRGPPMIRSKQWPWGFPWISAKWKVQLQLGNQLVSFTIQVLRVVDEQSRHYGRMWCAIFAEHPEDLGTVIREEDAAVLQPASIWQLADLRAFVEADSPLMLATVAVCQCCWGAPYRKPTRLLCNMPEVVAWGPNQWPTFDAQGHYVGPLTKGRCSCTPTVSLVRKPGDSTFRTAGTSAYPERFDAAWASALLAWFSSSSSSSLASEVGMRSQEEAQVPSQVAVEHVQKPNVERPEEEKLGPKIAEEAGRKREPEGRGAPMLAYYKGESRPINDGGGLCSAGRWPPGSRKKPKEEAAVALSSLVKKWFLKWISTSKREDPLKAFWKMAAGKAQESPFGEVMEEAREEVDRYLEHAGLRPRRKDGDRESEVNFRRLKAALQVMGDPDRDYLEQMASEGVPIGVDVELPRTPSVYEEKVKWAVDPAEGDYQDILAENYSSAEENYKDIRRQVLEEVEKGTILKMPLSQAQLEFKGRLAVAALGAVPKELNSDRVRLIHDGTYSVDINRRIRVKDRMRFPLVDDAAAVLASVEEHSEVEGSGIRFSMVYDVARAHKLVPVRREDWGLQAFRMPGPEDEDDDEPSVFMHTRGTFGVASAAYWWGRCAASMVRLGHDLADAHLELWHLLFADDGWLVAIGKWFWRKIMFWFFALDLCEFPISWKKVAGGVQVQWIGYQLNVKDFMVGISDRKKQWIKDWIGKRLAEGGVTGRELKAALGRLAFVSGALWHVRPFLGPIFSWSAMLTAGTFAALPDAVVILLDYISREVDGCNMRKARRPPKLEGDCFRVDAKAAGETVVIGGWESFGGVATKQARWFSVELSRKTAPWAYLRGDPFRAIASLELLAVLVAVMVLVKDAPWRNGRRRVVLPAYTDNLSNMHVLKKFGSSRYPLSIVAMELACQLQRANAELDLAWVPRNQNEEADALTNQRFEEFSEENRVAVDFESLDFVLLKDLMQKAGELDSELKLHKTSKEAKQSSKREAAESLEGGKRRRGEMKWKDPW